MATKTEQKHKLAEITNETDLKIVFDNKLPEITIACPYVKQNESKKDENVIADNGKTEPIVVKQNAIDDKLKITAIKIPLIQINKLVIKDTDIKSFRLDCTDFMPKITVVTNYNVYANVSTPGMANIMNVVLMPPVDGTYKKISLMFYITDVIHSNTSITYIGEYYNPEFVKKHNKIMKIEDTSRLNTYNMLSSIAKKCKLGFACTNMCKDIKDDKIRLLRNQTYPELIKEHLNFAGLGPDNIFDIWIDVYNNISLCNVSWVLNKSVKYDELSMKLVNGANLITSKDAPNFEQKFTDDTARTITNLQADSSKLNNKFSIYNIIVDNNKVKMHGTNNTYYILDSISNGGKNFINSTNIQIKENTNEGIKLDKLYNFEKNYYLGVEMGCSIDGNTPVLYQKQYNNAFKTRMEQRYMKVEMPEINFGLERGNLVNVAIMEYRRLEKITILKNMLNLSKDGNVDIEQEISKNSVYKEIINNTKLCIPNYAISGLYYIKGMQFVWKQGNTGIKQILYLYKKDGNNPNYYNFTSVPKI